MTGLLPMLLKVTVRRGVEGRQGLGLAVDASNVIAQLVPNGQAEADGLLEDGDEILEVDGKPLGGTPMGAALERGRESYEFVVRRSSVSLRATIAKLPPSHAVHGCVSSGQPMRLLRVHTERDSSGLGLDMTGTNVLRRLVPGGAAERAVPSWQVGDVLAAVDGEALGGRRLVEVLARNQPRYIFTVLRCEAAPTPSPATEAASDVVTLQDTVQPSSGATLSERAATRGGTIHCTVPEPDSSAPIALSPALPAASVGPDPPTSGGVASGALTPAAAMARAESRSSWGLYNMMVGRPATLTVKCCGDEFHFPDAPARRDCAASSSVELEGSRTRDGLPVAARRIAQTDSDGQQSAMREASVWAQLSPPGLPAALHAHIPTFYGVQVAADGELYLIHEHCSPGDRLVEHAARPLTPADAVEVAASVSAALAYMHAAVPALVHGAVGMAAVYRGADGRWKLGGFAKARPLAVGSEALPADDVWALGALLHVLLLETLPPPTPGELWQLPSAEVASTVEAPLLALLESCLSYDATHRPSASDVHACCQRLLAKEGAEKREQCASEQVGNALADAESLGVAEIAENEEAAKAEGTALQVSDKEATVTMTAAEPAASVADTTVAAAAADAAAAAATAAAALNAANAILSRAHDDDGPGLCSARANTSGGDGSMHSHAEYGTSATNMSYAAEPVPSHTEESVPSLASTTAAPSPLRAVPHVDSLRMDDPITLAITVRRGVEGRQGLGLAVDASNVIAQLVPNGQAEADGLLEDGDEILEVDGKPLGGTPMGAALERGRESYEFVVRRSSVSLRATIAKLPPSHAVHGCVSSGQPMRLLRVHTERDSSGLGLDMTGTNVLRRLVPGGAAERAVPSWQVGDVLAAVDGEALGGRRLVEVLARNQPRYIFTVLRCEASSAPLAAGLATVPPVPDTESWRQFMREPQLSLPTEEVQAASAAPAAHAAPLQSPVVSTLVAVASIGEHQHLDIAQCPTGQGQEKAEVEGVGENVEAKAEEIEKAEAQQDEVEEECAGKVQEGDDVMEVGDDVEGDRNARERCEQVFGEMQLEALATGMATTNEVVASAEETEREEREERDDSEETNVVVEQEVDDAARHRTMALSEAHHEADAAATVVASAIATAIAVTEAQDIDKPPAASMLLSLPSPLSDSEYRPPAIGEEEEEDAVTVIAGQDAEMVEGKESSDGHREEEGAEEGEEEGEEEGKEDEGERVTSSPPPAGEMTSVPASASASDGPDAEPALRFDPSDAELLTFTLGLLKMTRQELLLHYLSQSAVVVSNEAALCDDEACHVALDDESDIGKQHAQLMAMMKAQHDTGDGDNKPATALLPRAASTYLD